MSAFRRLTRSTIAATKLRLMVCPIWISLIWAMVKPSSSLGRPASGTSTSTTGATRRAIKKPTSVMAGVSAMTPIAEMRIQDSWTCGDSARADAIRLTSRKRVRTSRYEKKPIVSHGSIPAHGLRDRAERHKQPHADIDMQESEQENDGAREFHWKKVGAKAGTRKTCGSYAPPEAACASWV